MHIRYGFDITIEVFQRTPVLMRMDVHDDRRGDIVSEVQAGFFEGLAPFERDLHGNLVRRGVVDPGTARFALAGVIRDNGLHEVQPGSEPMADPTSLPAECLPYLVASRFCEVDLLGGTAWSLFGHLNSAGDRVRAIVEYVHQRLRFGYPFARNTRTALEAWNEQVGVCRDFAHLTIALCRALNIPARYVNGYLGDIGVPIDPAPMDFSAWVEVYLGGRWISVDARHNEPRIGRIVIARGLDATDVPMLHTFAPHTLTSFKVITEEIPVSQFRCAA